MRRLFLVCVCVLMAMAEGPAVAEAFDAASVFGAGWSESARNVEAEQTTYECPVTECGIPGLAVLMEMPVEGDEQRQFVDDPRRQLIGFKVGLEQTFGIKSCAFLSFKIARSDDRRATIFADGECVSGKIMALAVVFDRRAAVTYGAIVVSIDRGLAEAAREKYREWRYQELETSFYSQ